jgi:hypothetical protein
MSRKVGIIASCERGFWPEQVVQLQDETREFMTVVRIMKARATVLFRIGGSSSIAFWSQA